MKFRISLLIAVFIVPFSIATHAGEGMWLPQLLKALNEDDMQSLGFKLTAEDIYSINQGSLKDAIVHFGGYCTSEIISSEGLLLTNHHCGYGQIQSHSSVENNYLEEGFWAMNRSEELANPGLTAIMIKRIDDVTEIVLKGVTENLNSRERQSAIDKNIAAYKSTLDLEDYEDAVIKGFYKGNQYYMITTITYRDVRLVGAPPSSIGKFGADTDNWVWPRHTGDFALFRIYAGPDNLPANYSEDNVPYQPKKHLEVSTAGVQEGDFTLVFGFPGRTNEYLPSYALEQLTEELNPRKIAIRDAALKIVDKEMKADEKIKIQYASKFARIANYWKKWIGENQGLERSGGIEKKQEYEQELMRRIYQNPDWEIKYGTLLPQFDQLYQDMEPYAVSNAIFFETFYRNIELARIAYLSRNALNRIEAGEEAFNSYRDRLKNYLADFHKDYSPMVDKQVFARLMAMYVAQSPEEFLPEGSSGLDEAYFAVKAKEIFASSALLDKENFDDLFNLPMKKFEKRLSSDPAYQFFLPYIDTYFEKANGPYEVYQDSIEALMRKYMKVQMLAYPEKSFYPDANSTMRVTYGQVQSYSPRDAVVYEPVTTLEGVMEKYVPGDYEFDVPEKLIALYENKDYGAYADENGQMPVCFIGTNHTTGGNSGSPALDAYGRLIGLNFDRAWEGTMSDYNYDKEICRNIMVDVRYILFVIDKYAGAGHLVEEMDLVSSKVWDQRPVETH